MQDYSKVYPHKDCCDHFPLCLVLSWALGLVVGMFPVYSFLPLRDALISLESQWFPVGMETLWLRLLPFLICAAFVQAFGKWSILPVCFLRALLFGLCCRVLPPDTLVSDLLMLPAMLWFGLRSPESPALKCLASCFVYTLLVVDLQILLFSPMASWFSF